MDTSLPSDLAVRGVAAFGDLERFLNWFETPCYLLGGAIPEELVTTDTGLERVIDIVQTLIDGGVA